MHALTTNQSLKPVQKSAEMFQHSGDHISSVIDSILKRILRENSLRDNKINNLLLITFGTAAHSC